MASGVQTTNGCVAAETPPPRRTRLAFFGHDARESTVRKRVAAFRRNGLEVVTCTYLRRAPEPSEPPDAANIHLGVTRDRNYMLRLLKLVAAVPRIVAHRQRIRDADIIYARNLDMLLLAAAARLVSRSRAQLIYEVLDVQRLMLREDVVGRAARALERGMLARCDMLVVSAPDFMRHYFHPLQKFSGRWHLMENKPGPEAVHALLGRTPRVPVAGPPWTIGWFGTLRCSKSLDVLCKVADRVGPLVRIVMRGRPSEEDLSVAQIEQAIAGRSNMAYLGPYRSPDDLADIYSDVHFSWSVDYLDEGSNSDWLLPNRVYEGGLHGVAAIARAETATGDYVEQRQLGWALGEPLVESLEAFLQTLDMQRLDGIRAAMAARPRTDFVDLEDTAALVRTLAAGGDGAPAYRSGRLIHE